ncbi:MAG: ABC transporter permease [Oscillospiraceae bacterium]|nr:ABC transporter permease [Oscillospiraceae bacterium]
MNSKESIRPVNSGLKFNMVSALLKRDGQLFLSCLAAVLAVLLVFAVAAYVSTSVGGEKAEMKASPVSIALVDEDNSFASKMATSLVSSEDFVSDILSIRRTSEKKALKGLKSGAYAAVIILPEGYLDSIMVGERSRGKIILSDSAYLDTEIVSSATRLGELFLAAGQYGVFVGEELIWRENLGSDFHNRFLENSNEALISEALSGFDKYFELVYADYDGTGLSSEGYYASIWLSYILMIIPLFFGKLYRKDSLVYPRLKGMGLSPAGFVLGKLLYPMLFCAVMITGAVLLCGGFAPLSIGPGSLCACLLACLFSSVLTGFSMTLSGKGVFGFLFCIYSLGFFACGGLVPRALLPELFSSCAVFLPTGAVFGLIKPVFGGGMRLVPFISALFWLLASLLFYAYNSARPGKEVSL